MGNPPTPPVTSITIEFERMIGIRRPVRLTFYRHGDNNRGWVYDNGMIVFLNNHREPQYKAACHPSDTFSWEVGMRLCVKRIGNPVLYRAFRRWMWLAKAAHECDKIMKRGVGCSQYCDFYALCGETFPATKIAREFGRVKVRVRCAAFLASCITPASAVKVRMVLVAAAE